MQSTIEKKEEEEGKTTQVEVDSESQSQPTILPAPPSLGPKLSIPEIKKLSLAYLTRDEINKSVYAHNISINASLKQIYDFFSFCGPIQKFFVYLNEQKTKQFAIVVFQNENSFSTSLLLSNAVIVDEPIRVVEFRSVVVKNIKKDNNKEQNKISRPKVKLPEKKEIKEGITDFFATSYAKSEEFLNKVKGSIKKVDDDYKISEKMKKIGDDVKSNVKKIDEDIKFSKNMKKFGDGVKTGAKLGVMKTREELKKVDERYKISEKTQKTVKDIDGKLKISENTKKVRTEIQKGVKELGEKKGMKKMRNQVEAVLLEFKTFGDDTKKKIDEKRGIKIEEEILKPEQETQPEKKEEEREVKPEVTEEENLYPKIENETNDTPQEKIEEKDEVEVVLDEDNAPQIVIGNEEKEEEEVKEEKKEEDVVKEEKKEEEKEVKEEKKTEEMDLLQFS